MTTPERTRHPLVAYAELVRLPNLFTAPPDVLLGAALVAAVGGVPPVWSLTGLCVASVLLYAGGTVLNDYFDRDEDARHRPERPLPSGAVRPHRALTLGVAALAGGVATAGLTAGPDAGAVAGLLALAVLLYDASLKGSVAGSLAMGACRGLNVILGVAAAGSLRAVPPVAVGVAATVLVYIAGVTSMAEAETSGAGRGTVLVGVGAVGVAAAGVVGLLVVIAPPPAETLLAVALLVAFGAWTGRALRTAYANPEPATVGPAVGACVLGLVVLDAAFASTVGVGWGVVALVLLLPAVGLSRVFDVS